MDQRIKEMWVVALRSGEYRQGHGFLRQIADGKPLDCCLGVLCDLYARETGQGRWEDRDEDDESTVFMAEGLAESILPPYAVQQWAGLDSENPVVWNAEGVENDLAGWNDGFRDDGKTPEATFTEIAEMIERSL
jgi:hypothetical protein